MLGDGDVIMSDGRSSKIYYFSKAGQVNTLKTIELAKERVDELGIRHVLVASETGLSALEAIKVFTPSKLIVVSSAVGTLVEDTVIGDLHIGISEKSIEEELEKQGATVIRGTDPFWGLSAHTALMDTGKLGMMFYKLISSGFHVCMTTILEATDQGLLKTGEEVVALAGSWIGLDTAIVARACNTVDFFKKFEVLELVCKPRNPRYSWPIKQGDWVGDVEKYRRFVA